MGSMGREQIMPYVFLVTTDAVIEIDIVIESFQNSV